MDGDLTTVNPLLLQLSSNPEEWKQKRREALLRVFNGSAPGQQGTGAERFMPMNLDSEKDSDSKVGRTEHLTCSSNQKPSGDEKFVLQQLASMKRRRDDAVSTSAAPTSGTNVVAAAPPAVSLKDRLKEKFAQH